MRPNLWQEPYQSANILPNILQFPMNIRNTPFRFGFRFHVTPLLYTPCTGPVKPLGG